ncbi:MAG: hypothetical protein RL660_214 [Bacteroidota bacterium]|jgi:carboxyl-terminal processing protease
MPANNNISYKNPLLLAAAVAIGMVAGYKMRGNLRFNGNTSKLNEILQLVKSNYVDKINVDTIENGAIDEVLAQLDPHSVYIPPQDLAAADDDLDGDFDGIGIEYMMQRDTLCVTSVISRGPSATAGILSGDKIIQVNDSIIAGKKVTNETISKLLRGISGTKVKVTINRNRKMMAPITITRGKIPMYSVDAGYMLNANTGYIKINRFAATTHTEFIEKLTGLQKQGLQNLVLDLRDNPGGFLETASAVLDEFIAGKKRLVYTKARHGESDEYFSSNEGKFEQGKLVVLVNEGSASAAEITSGVVQDYDRGTIIGRRTFGKGLVQQEFKLSSGGAIRLTIARYFIPSGRCIQKDYSKGLAEYDHDLMQRYKSGELTGSDTTTQQDTTIYKTSSGRKVYGGGGITPDVFIALDTTKYTRALGDIFGSTLINEVANDYISENRANLQGYKDMYDFSQRFVVPQNLISNLQQACANVGITTKPFTNTRDVALMQKRIKALIAKSLYGLQAQILIDNEGDEFIEAALKELKK